MHRITHLFALSCIALIGTTLGQTVSSTQQDNEGWIAPAYFSQEEEDNGLDQAELVGDNDLQTTSSNNCSSYNPFNEFVPQGSDQALFVVNTNCKGRQVQGKPNYICKGSLGVGVGRKEEDDSWVCNVILPNGTLVEEKEDIAFLREPSSELGITLMWKINKQRQRRHNAYFNNRHRITSPVEIDEGVKLGKCKVGHHSRRWGHFESHRRHHNGASGRGRATGRQMWRRAEHDNVESTPTLETTTVSDISLDPKIGLIFGADNFVTLGAEAGGSRRSCSFYKILVCSNSIIKKPSTRWRRIQPSA